ncbi:DUF7848 domain-containing protein [Streptomyces flavofungini]|uniref:DUF7848 domain-containing protein n=1 Tax=Streptomyces flavofungini TaxID=68200 RepID=UPI0025B124F0|nr:hypothetical protein [Streptomyces flavofungini]WJV48357.1 hypothetical protein QUY26_24260 [Streptomyces flavofungini]
MSGTGGIARGRYGFAEWALTAAEGMAVRYAGKCLSCGERSPDVLESDDAQLWCLKHAGAVRHSGFEVSAFQYFDAEMVAPDAGSRAL